MKNFLHALLLSGVAIMSSTAAFSQGITSRPPAALSLNGYSVALEPLTSFSTSAGRATKGPAQYILQVDEALVGQAAAALEAQGGKVQDYLGKGVYLVRVQGGAASLTGIPGATAAAAVVVPVYKIRPEILGATATPAVVQFYPPVPPSEYASRIIAAGGTVLSSSLAPVSAIEANLSPAAALLLAASADVRSIGISSPDVALNLDSRGLLGASIAERPTAAGGLGLSGRNVVVGVGDNAPASYHVDTRDRAINFSPYTFNGHGSHVSGTVAGAGIIDPESRGIAPGATLLNHFFNQVWVQTATMRQNYGMVLTNNSYKSGPHRCDYNGTYDLRSSMLDATAINHPDVLHIFAVGNDGGDSCPPFPKHYASLPGGYQATKNSVNVAWLLKGDNDAHPNSSRGPTKDGRIKPEIGALGDGLLSTAPNEAGYFYDWGSSMASPGVTGMTALLLERYRQRNGGNNPPAALLKAFLLNGATDRGLPGPDFTFGFGAANLLRSVGMVDSARSFSATLSTGGAQTFSVNVPAGLAQLKVMLCYHDPAALPGAEKALINDLDLEVSSTAGTRLPLTPDPAPAAVALPATERVDNRNNVEQVTIAAPASGTYTVTVKGTSVPMGPQTCYVVYDFVQPGIRLLKPAAGVAERAGVPMRTYWEAVDTTGTFTIELSTDGGGAWTSVASNIPGSLRAHTWTVPATISSGICSLRVVRTGTGEVGSSGTFAINSKPAIALSPIQCPGYISLDWPAIPNATAYEVLRKIGPDMQPVDTVTATTFVFAGLSPDSIYYAAVRPLFGAVPGFRSNGIGRQPNTGSCAGSISDGDLSLGRLASPKTGREGTSSALSASQLLEVVVRNLDDATSSPYTISYRVNGGTWMQLGFLPIAALDSATVSLPSQAMSSPGTYTIEVAVTGGSSDPVRANDSLIRTVRQLANPAVNLAAGVLETFESVDPVTVRHDTMGLTASTRWDYSRIGGLGRLRSFVTSEVVIGGSRSISMDAEVVNPGTQNFLQATYNLSGYNAAVDEVRAEMQYRLHGKPKFDSGNRVEVRAADGGPWIALAGYDISGSNGSVRTTGSLSLTDALLASGGVFSTSTAIRIAHNDTSAIGGVDFGNGLTVDNVRLYTVQNDVQLLRVESPVSVNCGLAAGAPVRVVVRNGVQAMQSGISLFYRVDDTGAVQSATLSSIAGKDTVVFTFPQTLPLLSPGTHRLDVWLANTGDSYQANDSIRGFIFRNQPLITAYPYLQNFEDGDGSYFAEGENSSWAYGTPASMGVKGAASGTKAWKTGLTGEYNDREKSYLYTPCFDYSGLGAPTLSFSAVVDIEDCGYNYLCDIAQVEWSSDGGQSWQILGDSAEGFQWYNSDTFNGWTQEGFLRWHVATIPLPQGVPMPVRLRFSMTSDGGETREGLAIDDVHIYSGSLRILEEASPGAIVRSVLASEEITFQDAGGIAASIRSEASALGTTQVQSFTHANFVDSSTERYFLPRSFTVKPQSQPADSARIRLFVTEDDVLDLLSDSSCADCSRPMDVYRLGMTKYDSPNEAEENGSLSDNRAGLYNFYPYNRIAWVPYDRGYYAEAHVKGFSEFWFFDDGPSVTYPPADAAVILTARRTSATLVRLNWQSAVDSMVVQYQLQRAVTGDSTFSTILTKAGLGAGAAQTTFDDAPPAKTGDTVSYRVKWRTLDGSEFFTSVRRVPWTEANVIAAVYPNPLSDGRIRIRWSADPGNNLTLWVTDAAGKTVQRSTLMPDAFDNETTVNLPLAAGVYYLQVELAGKRWAEKIVVR